MTKRKPITAAEVLARAVPLLERLGPLPAAPDDIAIGAVCGEPQDSTSVEQNPTTGELIMRADGVALRVLSRRELLSQVAADARAAQTIRAAQRPGEVLLVAAGEEGDFICHSIRWAPLAPGGKA